MRIRFLKKWDEDKNLEWKRCLFCGKRYIQEDTRADLEISGIIWDEVKPQTIINGQILGEGDLIGNLRIEKIEKQKVILSDGFKKIELHI
ncbi:MAG: general secretion pathway protein GspB [Candidatus Omnitrophica bacterium]|nr:general secretion pathway protein GspB [Candidatus Omnitrophota bacterium]